MTTKNEGAKRTPGPWNFDEKQSAGRYLITGKRPPPHAPYQPVTVIAAETTNYDNAILIAAAPDLLRVAKEVAQWVRAYPELNQRCAELAEAAIAKAEGGK